MNNLWGRGGNGTAARGGGAGGIVFAAIISLVIGGAAGYGIFRTMDRLSLSDEIARREQRIEAMARELDAAAEQTAESTGRAQELTEANSALRRQVESLRNVIDELEASVKSENAQPAAGTPAQDFEAERRRISQQLADAEALRKQAEEAVRERDRQLSLQADAIAQLEKTLEEVRAQGATARAAEAELLEREVDSLRKSLEAAEAEATRVKTVELPELTRQIAEKDREIEGLAERNRALADRIAALEEDARRTPGDTSGTAGGDTPAVDNSGPADTRSPRNATLVSLAIQGTPGLDGLSEAQRDQLERTLVAGECVTNALGAVFARVPVLALRNLMRDLDSDC